VILFAFEAFTGLADALGTAAGRRRRGNFRVARYENGEIHIGLETPVTAEHCAVLGSIAPPDEQLLSALLLAHTLKKEGAANVTAVLPYLGYARHDKDKPGQSMGTAWVGSLMKPSGYDRVITMDVHSEEAKHLFPVPVISLSPAKLFADVIVRHGLAGATIVAPDEGAINRCEAVRAAAGIAEGRVAHFEKRRTETGVVHARLIGEVSRQAVLIDDILDTGATLVSACERLVEAGVEDIHVMVTHGLFTGVRWKELWRFGVNQIFCTDTIPLPAGLDEGNIVRLSIASLMNPLPEIAG
jgi:ribose-phosphate pyrophosphokinase